MEISGNGLSHATSRCPYTGRLRISHPTSEIQGLQPCVSEQPMYAHDYSGCGLLGGFRGLRLQALLVVLNPCCLCYVIKTVSKQEKIVVAFVSYQNGIKTRKTTAIGSQPSNSNNNNNNSFRQTTSRIVFPSAATTAEPWRRSFFAAVKVT